METCRLIKIGKKRNSQTVESYTLGKQLLFIICCLTLLLIPFSSNADVQLSLQPTPIVVGEPAVLTISSTEGKAYIDNLPKIKNLEWIQSNTAQSRNIITINGKHFEQTAYQFTVSKPGVIILPSMEITTNNDNIYTQEKKVRVAKGQLADLEKQLFIKAAYDLPNKKNIYTGEEIPLKINLYKADSLSVVPVEYPKIKMDNIVFDDFSKFNRENDRFAPYPYGTPERISTNGENFTKTTFFTSFRSLGSGPLDGTVSLLCNIKISRKNSGSGRFSSAFDDSFFKSDSFFSGSFFNRGEDNLSKLLVTKLSKINILPLPLPPPETKYLGLVGDWVVKVALSSEKIKEGEPLTLSLKISGTGTLETLNVPELSISGFTIYSPEIQKDGHGIPVPGSKSNVAINYILIPVDSGTTNIDVSFATFDTKKGQYETTSINKTVKIVPDNRSSKSIVYGNTPLPKASTSFTKSSKHKVSNAILYLKQQPGKGVLLPLWLNHIVLIIIFLLLGPLLWIITELIYFRKKRIGSSLILQRKNNALKRKNKVIKTIMKAPSDKLPDIIQKEAVPYINDLKGYPPGTTADELSNRLKGGKLAEHIKEANALSYMPTLKKNTSNLKSNLIKALKRLSVLIIIVLGLSLFCNHTFADSTKKMPRNSHSSLKATNMLESSNLSSLEQKFPITIKAQQKQKGDQKIGNNVSKHNDGSIYINQLITAYNNADFNKAEKICRENIHNNAPNPNWIYNLGNCYYQNGSLADALACYERALRLDPRNSDILENLNFVRRKLFLPEVYQAKTPIALLQSARDSFRPDEWMIIFAAAWFTAFIALIFKKFAAIKIWVTILSLAIIVAIISIIAVISEKAEVYNSKIALVIEKNVKIHTLPSDDSSKATFILNPGDQVQIKEKINKWLRIRKEKAEGWVKQDSVAKVWPY
jgi:tetratricopeptide (TPR) repeat protein